RTSPIRSAVSTTRRARTTRRTARPRRTSPTKGPPTGGPFHFRTEPIDGLRRIRATFDSGGEGAGNAGNDLEHEVAVHHGGADSWRGDSGARAPTRRGARRRDGVEPLGG